MSDIDKISEKIGSLTSSINSTRKTCDRILEIQETAVKDLTKLEMRYEALHERVDLMEPQIDKHQNIINKWTGFVLGISTFSAAIGAIVTKVFFPNG